MSGANTFAIQKLMRHKTLDVTAKYVEMWGNELRKMGTVIFGVFYLLILLTGSLYYDLKVGNKNDSTSVRAQAESEHD